MLDVPVEVSLQGTGETPTIRRPKWKQVIFWEFTVQSNFIWSLFVQIIVILYFYWWQSFLLEKHMTLTHAF